MKTTVEKELADQMGPQSILNGELFGWGCFLSQLLNSWFGAHHLCYFLKSMQLLIVSVNIKLEALQIQKPYCKCRTTLGKPKGDDT